jgi:pSer/pThr/pTyr-binding forkhead associated (FHA) protein/Mg-chelatase subunit ChlD
MIFSFTRFLSLVLMLALLPLYVATTAAEEKGTDPALEAIQALEQTTSPGDTTSPDAGIPDSNGVTATPGDTEATVSPASDQETPVPKDIVLVLDNSGSMKKNDPQFLASQAVTEFIDNLDPATHVAVMIFDTDVRVAMPLTEINDSTREGILESLKQINYKGQYTNSPDAIERAIYELKNNGRPEAKKAIIFMTDGIVDTGNAARDQEKVKWLKEDLAGSAADADIAIYGIAFTDAADFQLIQSLAQRTHGEYYRALKPEDLKSVYDNLHVMINKVAKKATEVATPAPPPPVAQPAPPPPAPVIIEVPAQPQPDNKGDRLNSMLIMAALAVMIIAVIFLVLMVIRSSRGKSAEDISAPEAFLNDIHGYTAHASYKLGNMPTILGRTAGTDTDHMNYIVIPQTTIGRRHALIEYKDYAYWIMDQGSINGTFVNDQMITGETRLKHGDRVRLHKYEFEFVMPEMVDAGMTVVSHTIMANTAAVQAGAKTVARAQNGNAQESTNIPESEPEPDFDLSEMTPPEKVEADSVDTVLKGQQSGSGTEEDGGDDETLMLDTDGSDSTDTDATLRPDTNDDEDLTVDHFHDNNKNS